MFRIKKFAFAAIALSALSLSVTGCFGEDETTAVTAPAATSDNTAIKDQGGDFEAGTQANLTLGSFISVRGDALSPEGFILTSGEKSAADEAALDLVFFTMTGTAKDKAGTPSFVSPNLVKADLNWAVNNKTIIVKSTKAAADFKTVQNVKDAIGASTSEIAAVSAGGVYAVALQGGKYGVLSVSTTTATSVTFRIIK